MGTPPASPPGEAAAPASAQGAAETAETDSQQPSRGTRFHLVQPGESLWTIAERLLGAEASTARVAHKVAQLWALNRDRIESGDADMIVAGTKLRLR